MMRQVETSISIKDMAYMIEILDPATVADCMNRGVGLTEIIDELPRFSNLRYIADLKEKEYGIDIIVNVKKINNSNSFRSARGTNTYTSIRVLDVHGDLISLMLWDDKPGMISKNGIKPGDTLLLLNANTRSNDKGKFLNLGNKGSLHVISEYVGPFTFAKLFRPKNGIKADLMRIGDIGEETKLVSISGKIEMIYPIMNIAKNNHEIKLGKITMKDTTGLVDITFWGSHSRVLDEMNVGDALQLTNLKVRMNAYTKKYDCSFTNNSAVLPVENVPIQPAVIDKNAKISGIITQPLSKKELRIGSRDAYYWKFMLRGDDDIEYEVRLITDFEGLEMLIVGHRVYLSKVNITRNNLGNIIIYMPKSSIEIIQMD